MKARRKQKQRDPFLTGKQRPGTPMTIRVDADIVHTLDAFRSDVEEKTGVLLDRRTVLEGLLRKVWKDKIIEAAVLEAGTKISGD